jgi:hypothetical protein
MEAFAQAPEVALDDPPLQRYVMRLGMDMFLRTAAAYSDLFDGNLMTGLVFMAISQASVQHLNKPTQINPDAVEGIFPDELRRPVSVLGVSQFLGLPYETTRRYVNLLVDSGYVIKVGAKGVMTPAEVMRRPEIDRLVSANYLNTRLFLRGLQRGGGDLLKG